jgi:plasmid stability protein
MVNVQVRNVDDEVVRRLKARAAQRGQNLQGFLADVLSAEAAVAANDVVLDEASADVLPNARRGGAAAEVRRGRIERDRQLDPRR